MHNNKKDQSDGIIISAIVPVYNTDIYLRRCIDSILHQDCINCEIVLVDDGSTDESSRICDEYNALFECIKVIHKSNGGLGSARIAGISEARGEYIAFIDSDDWIEPFTFGKLLDAKEETQDPDIVIGCYVEDREGVINYPFVQCEENRLVRQRAIKFMFGNKYFNWSLCDKLYKKSLLEKAGVVENWPKGYGEDTYANWKLFNVANYITCKYVCGYHYVMHDKSMMHQGISHDKFAYFSIYKKIKEEIEHNKSFEYLDTFLNTAFSVCIPIIYEAQEQYDEYENEIEQSLKVLRSFADMSDRYSLEILSGKLGQMFAIVNQPREAVCRRINDRDDQLKHYCGSNNIYIYGTGKIAAEVFLILNKLGINVTGFVVSSLKGSEVFQRKPVLAMDDFLQTNDNAYLLLAMNQKNTEEVIQKLEDENFYNFFDAGKYSIEY